MCCKSGLLGSCYSLFSYSTLLVSHTFEKDWGVCLTSNSSSITCWFLLNRFKHLVNYLVSHCLSYSSMTVNSLVYFADECSEVRAGNHRAPVCCIKQTSVPQHTHQKGTEPDFLVLHKGNFSKWKLFLCLLSNIKAVRKEMSGRKGGQTGRTWSAWYRWVDFSEERMVWLYTAQGGLFYA